jgi:hypothetical protein
MDPTNFNPMQTLIKIVHNSIPPVTRIEQFYSPSCAGTNITVMGKETVTRESLKFRLDIPVFFGIVRPNEIADKRCRS